MVKKTHGGKNEKKLRLKNEKNLQFKKHTNKHHIYPTSRFILKKNPVLHTAWHDVFEDSTPEEAVEKVEEWMTDSKKFKEEVMENERKTKAWEMLFSGLTTPLDEVLRIIKSDWTFPGVKMIKTSSKER